MKALVPIAALVWFLIIGALAVRAWDHDTRWLDATTRVEGRR